MSNLSGYFAARTFKMFKGTSHTLLAIVNSILYPLFIFVTFGVVGFFNRAELSEGYIPFKTAIIMLMIHITLSIPNAWLGSFIGFQKDAWKLPGTVSQIPKEIPAQPWYQSTFWLVTLGGAVPFMGILGQVIYVMQSVWRAQFYYMFGVLFLILLILIITAGEVAIVQTYFQLNSGNH
jgi:transmembrane 9 superfamily protein 2/4